MKKKLTTIQSSDIDQFLELSVPAFFMMMQKIATADAEEKGIGKSVTLDKGYSWVITRIEVDFKKTPKYTETVNFETYPGDDMKVMFPRYYRMFNTKGEQVVTASSIWALINQETRQAVINPTGVVLPAEHYENELPLPRRVKLPEDLALVESRRVRYSDIDLNGHLNNTKYTDYILDVHDSEFYKKNRISHFLINFTHELKDNEVVDIYSNGSNPEVVVGKVGEQLIFACEITYDKR